MTLQEAIERSISHNEIVQAEHTGGIPSLMHALRDLHTFDVDHSTENDGRIDVWGYYRDEDFRIAVTLND